MTGIDLGGHAQVRRVWKDYYGAVDVVVFMVDAADSQRLAEARTELQLVLTELPRNLPILIMANKIDQEVQLLINTINNTFWVPS